ncbi:uncharacterized protein [Diadema setosum]|uniref:uncharacterized protein n=1 Tax=Diadema setosum TaxID=31175 RepID=UPI003B3B9946
MNNARSRRQRGFRVFDCSTHKSIPAQEDVKMGSEYQAEGALNPVVMVRRSRRLRMRQNGVPAVAPSGGKPVRVPERNVGRNGGRKQRALKAIRKPRVAEEESRNVPKRVTTLPAPPNNTPTIGVQTGCHISDETMTELSAFVTNQLSFHEDDSDANETLADLLPNFDPLVMSPYVIDVLEYYQSNETKSILPDYGDHPPVDPAHRRVLVDWLIDVQNHLCLGQETLHLSVALLDAFLWKRPVSLNDLQLLGVTCLLVACKYEEIYLPDVDTLCALCANAYKPRQILTMERRILRVFRFDLFYPTATGFLNLFLVLTEMQDDEKIVHVCNYLLDLALVDFELQRAPPSKRAAAALFVALRLCEDSCRKRASDRTSLSICF